MLMKIFIIGSYSGENRSEIKENVERAVKAGQALLQKGHLPLVPQSMFAFWEDDIDMSEIMEACFGWIEECDAVLCLNVGSEGGGTWRAREVARKSGKRVFGSLDEVP